MTLHNVNGSNGAWTMAPGTDADCTGRVVPHSQDQLWDQTLEHDAIGSSWGGDDPGHPAGLACSPTYSSYGWNDEVASKVGTPALVIHGLGDPTAAPANAPAIYAALPAANKLLVQVKCASHGLLYEGCSGRRCQWVPGPPWGGPHATLKAALIEWVEHGTFEGAANGSFVVDETGVATAAP